MPETDAMLSIVITAYREEKTIGRTIAAFRAQGSPMDYEFLVICPDDETAAIVAQYAAQDKRIRHLRDEGRGKPAALNLALETAQGQVVILSDGDVYALYPSVHATPCWATGLTCWWMPAHTGRGRGGPDVGNSWNALDTCMPSAVLWPARYQKTPWPKMG